jgi:hypothetical protein
MIGETGQNEGIRRPPERLRFVAQSFAAGFDELQARGRGSIGPLHRFQRINQAVTRGELRVNYDAVLRRAYMDR